MLSKNIFIHSWNLISFVYINEFYIETALENALLVFYSVAVILGWKSPLEKQGKEILFCNSFFAEKPLHKTSKISWGFMVNMLKLLFSFSSEMITNIAFNGVLTPLPPAPPPGSGSAVLEFFTSFPLVLVELFNPTLTWSKKHENVNLIQKTYYSA